MPSTLTRPAPARPSVARASQAAPNPSVVLAIILACYLMIVLDVSVSSPRCPKIHHALGFSPTGLSWVQNAYTLTFGGLLLLGARAGDILGRRRVFVGRHRPVHRRLARSAASRPRPAGCSPRARCRASAPRSPRRRRSPCSRSASAKGHERTRAIAYYSAVAGGGGSVGLVLGGMLTDLGLLALAASSSTCRSASR